MAEADGGVEDAHVVLAELEAFPLPVGRRPTPEIDQHINDGAAPAAHELRATGTYVEMHPPDRPVARSRMIVLHHLLGDAKISQLVGPIGLGEEAAVVTEHGRLNQEWPVEARVEAIEPGHAAQPSTDRAR